jgi:predicted DNA-binding transcriptional regulator AlpA
MSGVIVENGTTSVRRQRDGHRSSSARFDTKKMPLSVSQPQPDHATSSNLDDVAFIRLPEVKAVTGLSKTTIYELIRTRSFPAPVRLAPRSVAWVKSEIRDWAIERVHASRSAA